MTRSCDTAPIYISLVVVVVCDMTVWCCCPLQAVELENSWPRKVTKYLVLVATSGYQDTEEAIVLGTEQEDSM